jgi:phosphoribosyl 1,2-cyclic phosphodiesterase
MSETELQEKIRAALLGAVGVDLTSPEAVDRYVERLLPSICSTAGGNTACVEVRTNSGLFIIFDSGTGIRELGLHLAAQRDPVSAHLMLGHTHWDHISGFPFFAPLFESGNRVVIYGAKDLPLPPRDVLAGQMGYAYFPVPLGNLQADIAYAELEEGEITIDDVVVRTHYLNHTAICMGYRVEADGVSVAYITDHEPFGFTGGQDGQVTGGGLRPGPIQGGDQLLIDFVRGVDLLIQDAQYSPDEYAARRGWGHSSTDYVTDIGVEAGARRLALFHHEPTHADDDIDRMVESARGRARAAGSEVDLFAAAEGHEIEL